MKLNSDLYSVKSVDKKGKFIKPCPGTPRHVCCGYYIIDYARGCNLGCTYCILDYYKNNKELTIFQNREYLYAELDEFVKKKKGLVRLGTGEFTDSLLFERNFPIYKELIPCIARYNNAILEIKTKTVNIEGLLEIPHHDSVIVSWSLNSSYIAENEELGAPSIDERIDASYRMQIAGYKLAFHFDPIIVYDKWEKGYESVIHKIFRRIDPENVVYISMGTLRYTPEIVGFLDKMGPYCRRGEFVRGLDNKMRYFRPLRTGVYKTIKSYLQRYVDPGILYMCMESPIVWEDVFEIKNMSTKKLTHRLDNACIKKFTKLVGFR